MNTFNRNLALTIILLSAVVTAKLYSTASITDNWRGLWYSLLHIAIVGLGSYLALRKKELS